MRYKDLGDLILADEFHHGPSDIPAAKDACFDLQTPREEELRTNASGSLLASLNHRRKAASSSFMPARSSAIALTDRM